MPEQLTLQETEYRHITSTGFGLGLDNFPAVVECSLNSDEVRLQVHVRPSEFAELAAAEPGVEGGGPNGAIGVGQSVQKLPSFSGRRYSLPATRVGRNLKVVGRIDCHYLVAYRAAEDGSDWIDRISNSARRVAGRYELVDQVLEEMTLDLGVSAARARDSSALAPRELAVLKLMAGEGSYSAIAEDLSLTQETVRTYAKHVRRKLGVSSRSEAVELGRLRGWLD